MEIGPCAAEPSRCHVRNRTDNFRVRKRDAPVWVLSMLYRIVYAVWILLMLYGYYICCRDITYAVGCAKSDHIQIALWDARRFRLAPMAMAPA